MEIEQLNRQIIQKNVKESKEALNIELLDKVSSTNDVAKQLLNEQVDKFTLIATNKQTAGRGRSGNFFYSMLDHGLYFSLAFQPNTNKIEKIPLYTMLAATTLVEVFEEYIVEDLSIKWVNDIFYKGRKVIGILSEMVTTGATQEIPGIVIGIGINLAGDFTQADDAIQAVAGTLFGKEIPKDFNQNKFLSQFLNRFFMYHQNFSDEKFLTVYEKHLLGLGQKIYYFVNKERHEGVIQGINEKGHLLVLNADQTIKTLYGQEVHFGSQQFITQKE